MLTMQASPHVVVQNPVQSTSAYIYPIQFLIAQCIQYILHIFTRQFLIAHRTRGEGFYYICICYTCNQAFTVILKGLLEDSRSFNEDPSYLTLNHGFPIIRLNDAQANALSALLQYWWIWNRTPIFCVESRVDSRYHYTTNSY